MSDLQTPETTVVPEAKAPTIPEGFVTQEVYDRMKKDMFKHKADSENNKKAVDDQRLARLKESQNWEAVAKEKEQEAQDEKAKRQNLETSLVQHQKYQSLRTEALKHGMHPGSLEDLELLDLPEVSVETTSTGKILVTGADRAISNLKTMRPHWFQTKAPSINPSSPESTQVNQQQITTDDIIKLEAEFKKNPIQANKDAYFNAIKKYKTK